jgi:hypothetical protein
MTDCSVIISPQRPSYLHIVATTTALLAASPALPLDDQSRYADYTKEDNVGRILTGSLTIVTLFKEIANLVPNAGPLCQVLGATKELISVINEMQCNREDCEHLVERILLFVKSFVEELARMNVPLQDGTPTAARLYALLLWVKFAKFLP